MEDTELTSKAKLRIEFIGMAFALAVGQVGLEIGDFYSHNLKIHRHMYVFTQLLLGTYIIASSWVGWQKSKSRGHLQEIDNTFSKSFIILLVDLFLVICYFIIVKSVEKPYESNYQATVTANPEIFWSLTIFGAYIVWDILTKWFDFDSKTFHFTSHFKEYVGRLYQAPLCFLLLIAIDLTVSEIHDERTVIFADLCLILVFILFRGLKETIREPNKHTMIILLKYFFYIAFPIVGILLYFINFHYRLI
jgi:hypothetical protein